MLITRYIELVTQEIDIQERYHNHKETMAWTVTAFYVVGVITFGRYVSTIDTGPLIDVGFCFVASLVAFLVLTFVNMQFRMRWAASDTVAALMKTVARLCTMSVPPPPSECVVDTGEVWPRFIQAEILRCHSWKPRKLGRAVIDLFRHWRVIDDRWRTELPSYGLIIMATGVAIVMVCN